MFTIIIQEYFTYRLLFTINVKEISRQFLVTFLKSSHPFWNVILFSVWITWLKVVTLRDRSMFVFSMTFPDVLSRLVERVRFLCRARNYKFYFSLLQATALRKCHGNMYSLQFLSFKLFTESRRWVNYTRRLLALKMQSATTIRVRCSTSDNDGLITGLFSLRAGVFVRRRQTATSDIWTRIRLC